MRIVPTDREHMARVAFTYPDEEEKKLKAAEDAKRAEAERQKAEASFRGSGQPMGSYLSGKNDG